MSMCHSSPRLRWLPLLLQMCIVSSCLAEGEEDPLCTLYMGESSNPRGGWGTYTGINLDKGQTVEPRDVAIPFIDADYYRAPGMDTYGLLTEYMTKADEVEINREAQQVVGIIPGNGMLANSHPGLDNMEMGDNCIRKIPSFNRTHPAVGSSTHVHGVCFKTRRAVPAGSELFAVYGDDWYRDRADQFPNVALSKDYIRADALLYKFEYLVDRDFDSPLAWSLWDLFRDVLQDLRPNILQIVPNDAPQVGEILEKYGEDFRLTTAKASNPDHQRTPEWLRENAFCMDNIVGRNTTDKGMGAFATRSLKRGIVVAPLPLLHLHRRMLQMEWRESVSTMWKGDQLLLNYVFGHPQSTVLLFPYSTAVAYVNHGRPANVALRWSDRMPRPERLKEPAEKLHDDWFESGLMLEMYALRDIQTDEEILLDYGDEWIAAWEDHVARWSPPAAAETYLNAEQYHQLLASGTFGPDFNFEAMAGNVDLFCFLSFQTENGTVFYEHNPTAPLRHCRILSADPGPQNLFRVQYFLESEDNEQYFVYNGMPLYALTFRDKEYTSDFHLRNAFRHEIGLPPGVFPDAWKNREPPKSKRGRSMADRMNDRVDWVKTVAELKSKPYPKGVRNSCLLYVEPEVMPKDAASMKWTFNRTFMMRELMCDIISREYDEEFYYFDEIVARSESTKPLPVHYTATVFFPRFALNVTSIPRSAIRFK